jgi:hypothetical protein
MEVVRARIPDERGCDAGPLTSAGIRHSQDALLDRTRTLTAVSAAGILNRSTARSEHQEIPIPRSERLSIQEVDASAYQAVRGLGVVCPTPTTCGVYDGLGCGESFVPVNNHDPVHLHDEFEIEYAGGFGREYLERGP